VAARPLLHHVDFDVGDAGMDHTERAGCAAVSCNAATFARDARLLVDGGYKCDVVTPVDQFRHTPHVELVARFCR
jgi:hypothetical protein